MPTSEKRIAANRANAAKSTGPTSVQGKINSSRNSTRHGILANAILIDNESPERFADLLTAFNDDFSPTNHTQRLLVEKMAASHWRLMRIWAVESAGIIRETRSQSEDTAADNPPTKTMRALRAIDEHDRHSDLMGRYETRYDKQYYRALDALLRLQELDRSPAARSQQPKENKANLYLVNPPEIVHEPTRIEHKELEAEPEQQAMQTGEHAEEADEGEESSPRIDEQLRSPNKPSQQHPIHSYRRE